MGGTLEIHTSGGGGGLLDGHSWIAYTDSEGVTTTYGTWGNDPIGEGNGLHRDLEKGRVGDAVRTATLNDTQEAKLFAKIKEYERLGDDGWSYLNPCSGFATDAWEAATGESLEHRTYGVISNPNRLITGIRELEEIETVQGESSSGRWRWSTGRNGTCINGCPTSSD